MDENELEDEDTLLDEEDDTPPEMPDEDDAPPDKPEDDTTPPDSNSSSVTWNGATVITEGGSYDSQKYTSTTANQNALLIYTSANVTLNNPTVTKSGGGDASDNSSFYGTNAGVLAVGGGKTTINGGTVNTSAAGANGVFSYGGNGGSNGASGDGTTIVITDTTINTTGDGSGGIMTTGGGNTKASNLTVTTSGRSSAPIRTDRGGGNVTVSGGSYTSSGLGSPAIYSTATITVENASLTSNKSEGVCIEGQNSVALTNCTLTANNTATNGQATFLDSVMIYQSMSGDSSEGTATFTMTGGVLNSNSGHAFHVTNTDAVINLNNVTINNASGVLLSVCDDGWSGASNVATLNATNQTLSGDILVGDDSTLTLNLKNGSTFAGNIGGAITNAKGSVVSSTVGEVNVILDASSKWYLTGDAHISDFSGDAANIITNGFNVYVNDSILEGTTIMDETNTSATVDGGITPTADSATLKVDENLTGNVVDLRAYPEVTTLDALNAPANIAGGLVLIGNTNNNLIVGSSQNANIMTGFAGNNTLTFGSAASDEVYYSGTGNDLVTDFASGSEGDRVFIDTALANGIRNGAAVALIAANGNALLLNTDSKDGAIQYSSDGQNFYSAQIADQNESAMIYSANSNFFAFGQQGTLVITGAGDNDVRLDGSTGQGFYNVANLDASTSTGNNSLGGDANANVIIGGSGFNVLWGGTDLADDLLVGGSGVNNFFIGKGNGNDVVTNASSDDVVSLFDASLSDIVATVVSGAAIAVAFNTGNVVMVGSTETLSAKFTLSDGSAYQYNHETQSWQEA